MEDKYKYSGSQLFNSMPNSYLERTSRPVYALFFLLPFIVFYELGTIFINTSILDNSQIRVVTFLWLQNALEYIGLGSKFAWAAPALVVVIILIALQITSRKSWRFIIGDSWPMAVECILLSAPLIVLSLFLNSSTPTEQITANSAAVLQQSAQAESSVLANIVTGIGAGIYEELVFRLILICLFMILFQDFLRVSHKKSMVLSVILSAALFSAHHQIVFLGGEFGQVNPFVLKIFVFRTIAGIYFGTLFAIRGFGITAGTHSFYDIIATLINAYFFS